MFDHELHDCALGSRDGFIRLLVNPADTGDTHVVEGSISGIAYTEAKMYRMDSYAFAAIDFIKIDCEGFELDVLSGAVDTLRRCKPCVIVEQKQHKMQKNFGTKGTPAVEFLRSLGAVLRKEMGGDYIMSWDA
jgi:hypothetical protein